MLKRQVYTHFRTYQDEDSMKINSTKKKKTRQTKPKKISRIKKPADMALTEWQAALRKEYGSQQNFQLKNIGDEPIFSEFLVTNPQNQRTYRVAIRGKQPGNNYCSCPDYAVNLLGTCKHIEFTLSALERKRGAKKQFKDGFTPAYSEIYLRYGQKQTVCFSPGTECPQELREYASTFFTRQGELKANAYLQFHTFMKNASAYGHDLRCYQDTLQFIAQLRDDHQREKRVNQMFRNDITSAKFKSLLNVDLYPYQRRGALFAAKAGRCLIGDDMGLGKTIQAIAATEILAQTSGVEKVLVICPTSLKHQWRQEIERFTNRTHDVLEGGILKRRQIYQRDTFYKITNYEVIHRDHALIEAWAPDVIILDEAQRIKNWNTRRAQAVKRLQSKYAFVLTGTPLENRLEELHSIIEFVDCFRLGPLYYYLDKHQQIDDVGKVIGYKDLSSIAQTLEPILIRRTKDEVLKELPKRIDKHFFVPMTKEQAEIHESAKETVAYIVAKWRRMGFLLEKDQLRLQSALQTMRMSCNSTFLVDKQSDHGLKSDEAIELFEEILEDSKAKIVVFSQWLGTHQLLINRLESKPWQHVFFHGQVPSAERGKLIQQFKDDPHCRIFFSTDAGGVGLNLQNASVVVNMDQPWNPAILEQRIGRVHRLGQMRPVQVFNFVAQGTIEHNMLDVLKFKKSLFAGVLDGGENEVFLGGSKLKKFMDTVDQLSQKMSSTPPTAEQPDEDLSEMAVDAGGMEEEQPTAQQTAGQSQDIWAALLSKGVDLISQLSQAVEKPDTNTTAITNNHPFVGTDEKSGERFIKLPMPDQDTMNKISEAAKPFLAMLQNWPKQ
jgi:SNF2 family DNA or RNA helicase